MSLLNIESFPRTTRALRAPSELQRGKDSEVIKLYMTLTTTGRVQLADLHKLWARRTSLNSQIKVRCV